MKYIVIEKHETEFPNPIFLKNEEKVIIGEESKDTWANWVFCTKSDKSNSGWVPKQIIRYEGSFGYILEEYYAKELNIEKGCIINGFKELNGWIWCECESTNEIGWVPLKNIEKME